MANRAQDLTAEAGKMYEQLPGAKAKLFFGAIPGRTFAGIVVQLRPTQDPAIRLIELTDNTEGGLSVRTYASDSYRWESGALILEKEGLPTIVLPTQGRSDIHPTIALPGEQPQPFHLFDEHADEHMHPDAGMTARDILIAKRMGESLARGYMQQAPGDLERLLGSLTYPQADH